MTNYRQKKEFQKGLKQGIPIALGYLPVSFTFGLMAVSGGLPVWLAIFISFSNLTSAGQFAGTNLILTGAGFFEIGLTTFIINIRYMLMSLSLSQKLEKGISIPKRLLFSFGITDETFALASLETGKLTFPYMMGLICCPFFGWLTGTALGALICSALPASVSSAMGIALYAMFIAIIIPVSKRSRAVLFTIIISVFLMCLLRYIKIFGFISSGFRVILTAVAGACIAAIRFPIDKEDS